MRLQTNFKRWIAFLLLFLTIGAPDMGVATAFAETGGTASYSEYVTLVRAGEERLGPYFVGDEAGADQHRFTYPLTVVENAAGTAGYCIEPFVRGVSPNGTPQTLSIVPDSQLDAKDKQLLGIMMAGYPNKTHGWSDDDEYMATQVAVQHFVFQNPDKYPNAKHVTFDNDDWSHWENTEIIELAKLIYNEGMAKPYDPNAGGGSQVTATAENSGVFADKGEILEINITIAAISSFQTAKLTLPDEIRSIVKSGKGSVTIDGKAAGFKSYILGSGDSSEGIEIKPGDHIVKITLDKLSAEAYVPAPGQTLTTSFQFQAVGGDIFRAYKGINLDASSQDYIFLVPGTASPVTGTLKWTKAELPEIPEIPDIPEVPGGGLKLLKYNKKTNQLVSGAIFEIRGVSASNWDFLVQLQASPGAAKPLPDGGTAVTGVGYIELRDIRPGQYQVTEITPPPNFDYCDLGVNSQVVTVTAGEVSGLFPQVRFENNPYASLRIRKIDSVTGSPVNGAILRIRNPLTGFDVEMATANGGVIELNNLPQGNYEITEVFTPNKYLLSNERKIAALRWGETTDVTFENQPKTELRVIKVDSKTGKALDGAIFRLTKPDTGSVYENTTYFDGYAVFSNIPAGIYVLEEIKAPSGYILDTNKRTVVIENNKTNEIYIPNFKTPGLIIRKVDEDTALPLPGAEFRVAKMSGQIVFEGITDENGLLCLDGLSSEWFKITEIAAPFGYLTATETKDVFLEPGQVLEVKFDNRRRPALEILKVDEQTKEPLADAVFHVQKNEDSTVSEYITDASGRILIENLDEAVYSVTEIKSPDGYILNPQHKDIQLEWGNVKQLVFTNMAKPKLRILKIDAVTGEPLPFAEFRVTKVEDKTVSEFITDATGEILIENLDEAVYKVEEFLPPDGYIKYDDAKEIALEGGMTKTVKFDNVRKPTLIVTKLNGLTNQPVSGATYKIEYEAPNGGLVPLGSYLTDANGQIVIPKVSAGWYVVTETKAAPGFSLPSNPVTRIYLSPGENAYLSEGLSTGTEPGTYGGDYAVMSGADFTPTLNASGELVYNWPLNSIVIKKTHAITGELLAGAAFELYRADQQVSGVPGTNVGRFTTDNSGVIVITGLDAGFYVVKEVQAPQNFLLSENSMQNGFLKADGTTVLEFTFANYPYGSILVTKVDAITGKPLANARFRVTDASGAVAGNTNGEFVTNENGEFIVPNLKPGAYVITETNAPEYYTIDSTPQTVNVGTDGKVYKTSFKNQPAGEIVIRKLDYVTKEPLAGAEFKVTASDGSVVGTSNGIFKTDATGTIKIRGLSKGTYVIEETAAPTGYVLENQTQTVAVDYGKTSSLPARIKPFGFHLPALKII